MLQLYTNAGMAKVIYEGDMPELGVCWYYEDGIANVVSQAKAAREIVLRLIILLERTRMDRVILPFVWKPRKG